MVLHKKLHISVAVGILIPVFALGPVFALPNVETVVEDTTTTTTETVKKTREERLAERKAALQLRLTAAQETRLKGRCRAAQVILGAYGERLNRLEEKRSTAHANILTKLNDIVTRVGDQADTTALEASITELQTKIDNFAGTLDDYQEAVDDLAKMECTEDPAAFKATLETVRTQRKSLLEEAKAIRKYVLETIKPQLQAIKTAVRGTDEEGETE